MAKSKRTNNDLPNTTQKTNDRTTRTRLKTGGEFKCQLFLLKYRYLNDNILNVDLTFNYILSRTAVSGY